MTLLCALDWRHGLVSATLTADPDGSVRLALAHGPDQLVVHLSPDSLDALTLAGLAFTRPDAPTAWEGLWPNPR
jgi:hypothetical protein